MTYLALYLSVPVLQTMEGDVTRFNWFYFYTPLLPQASAGQNTASAFCFPLNDLVWSLIFVRIQQVYVFLALMSQYHGHQERITSSLLIDFFHLAVWEPIFRGAYFSTFLLLLLLQ